MRRRWLIGVALTALIAVGLSVLIGGTWWRVRLDQAAEQMAAEHPWGDDAYFIPPLRESPTTACEQKLAGRFTDAEIVSADISTGPVTHVSGTITVVDAGSWLAAGRAERFVRTECPGAGVARRANALVVAERTSASGEHDERAGRELLTMAVKGWTSRTDLPPS